MLRRTHLRTRVLLLTAAFAVALFAITFGLSWRARKAEERWSRLVRVETEAIATLEDLIRAQNTFVRGTAGSSSDVLLRRYRAVAQLLEAESLAGLDVSRLHARRRGFENLLESGAPRRDLEEASALLVREAQRLVELRRREIARTLPELEREGRSITETGLAVAWIVIVLSFAAVQTTLRKVVRPLEDLAAAADRIAAGDLSARARVAGDHEIARLATALNGMADELRSHARTDELTGMPNFRAFRERIDGEILRSSRYGKGFGILVLDLDRFKKYNDTYGHLAGNEALQRVARVIAETVRTVDFAARYGGEEFAVIVPEVDVAALAAVAERIREGVEALPAPEGGATVTVSIGAALYPDDGASPDALFQVADERLYKAKEEGRNRVVTGAKSTVSRSFVAQDKLRVS